MLRRPLVHVQNDIPVFFIRDGIKFVDLVHSLKPSPKKHVQEGWRVLDFLSHHPESCNIVRVPLGLHEGHCCSAWLLCLMCECTAQNADALIVLTLTSVDACS
jgi:Catalase